MPALCSKYADVCFCDLCCVLLIAKSLDLSMLILLYICKMPVTLFVVVRFCDLVSQSMVALNQIFCPMVGSQVFISEVGLDFLFVGVQRHARRTTKRTKRMQYSCKRRVGGAESNFFL